MLSSRMQRQQRAALGLDLLTALLGVLSVAIARAGGLDVRYAGIHVSATTPTRALVALAVVVLIRRLAVGHIGPLGVPWARWQQLLPAPGTDPFLVPAPAGRALRTVYAGLGLALALGVLLHDQLGQLHAVPDLGDPLFSIWRVGWVTHQVMRDPLRLFDANIFHPEPLTLTLSDPMILTALVSAPLLALGVHPIVAYNLVFLSAFWLSGLATYLLVERLSSSARAAFVAGLIYACASFRFDHYSHLEIQMTHWIPLGLLALHLFLSTGRWVYAAALALAAAAQLYSSMYFAVFFLLFAAVVGASLLVLYRPPIRPMVLPAAAAMVLAAALATPLALAFLAAQPLKGERGVVEVSHYSAEPADYLRAHRFSALWQERLGGAAAERALFPGAAPLALGILGLMPPLGGVQLAYGAGLLASIDGSLGLKGLTYPALYRWFAPLRGLRVPARFVAIVSLALAILAGFGARYLLRRCRSRPWADAVFAGLVALVVADAWPALRLQAAFEEPPGVYEAVRNMPGVVLAEFPMPQDEIYNIPYMYFSLWHWARLVNGYSGFIPQSYAALVEDVATFPDADAVAALRRRGVTHVTVNCGLEYAGCDQLQRATSASASLLLVVETQWRGQPARLYRVLDP